MNSPSANLSPTNNDSVGRDKVMLGLSDLAGAWTLESWAVAEPGSAEFTELWPGAVGMLIYSANGGMSATIANPDWTATGTPPERGFAEGMIAYCGRVSVAGDEVHHHVTVSNIRLWVGTIMSRKARLENGNILHLLSPETLDTQGSTALHRIRWRRLDAQSSERT
jgi:hypothetical protein